MEINEALRLLRKEVGLTQTELAEKLHMGFSAVSRWENKNVRPNRSTSYALLEFAKKSHVSSICLDNLEKVLFSSRIDNSKDIELEKKITDSMKAEKKILLSSSQSKMIIDNINIGIITARIYNNTYNKADFIYYNNAYVDLFGYDSWKFNKLFKVDPFFAIEKQSLSSYFTLAKKYFEHEINTSDFVTKVEAIKKDNSIIYIEVRAISLQEYSYGQELIVSCKDITEKEQSIKKYQEEIAYRNVSLSTCYSVLHLDLTNDCLLRQQGSKRLVGYDFTQETIDEMLIAINHNSLKTNEQEQYRNIFNRANFIDLFNQSIITGNTNLFNLISQSWLKIEYYLVKNPTNNHLEVLVYSYNIQKQVITNKLMDIISQNIFDYIGYITIDTGILYTYYSRNDKFINTTGKYDDILFEQIKLLNDKDKYRNDLSLNNLIQIMNDRKFVSYKVIINDYICKIIKLTYLDNTKRIIVITQIDDGTINKKLNIL